MGKKRDNYRPLGLSSARMRPHHLLAAALLVAPATASATQMEPATDVAKFVAAGEAAAERAPRIADPQERALELFRGYQSWMDAYDADGEQSRLRAARLLLLSIVDDDELGAAVRSDAAELLAGLEAQLETPPRDSQSRVPLIGEAGASPEPQDEAVRATGAVLTPAASVDSPRVEGRGLLIAGGVTLGVGASLLGAMTYGLVEDFRAAAEIRDFTQQKEARTLTNAEWARSQTIVDRGRSGAQLATLAGISGGLSVVTGAVLLFVGRRRKRSQNTPLAITPSAGAGQAHIMLRGRF